MRDISLRINHPFEAAPLKTLFIHAEDFPLLRPGAKFPFEDREWISYFSEGTCYSVLVYLIDDLIGHFGLVKEDEFRFRLVFVYLTPALRGKGVAAKVLKMAEEYALREFGAQELSLKVQDFNSRAFTLYRNCGFKEFYREGTTINMEKRLSKTATTRIYRIMSESEWRAAQGAGRFEGSADDRRDGFIHFSTAEQVVETAAVHYAGKKDLLLLGVDANALTAPLKWEVSRGGQLFPHLYGPLPVDAVSRVEKLTVDPDGRFIFPELEQS